MDLDERIGAFDAEFAAEAKHDEATRRLTSIPGIGALNTTALVAAVGDANTFSRGRDLAAWLGLVPLQMTTGGKPRLLGITRCIEYLSGQEDEKADFMSGKPMQNGFVESFKGQLWTSGSRACVQQSQ